MPVLSSPYQSSPLKGALAHSTVKAAIDGVTHYSYGEGPLPLPYGRVLKGPMVEPAYASLTVEPASASSPSPSPLLNSRAPKGDGGLNSRACLRILNSRAPDGPYGRAPKGPMVERLRSLSVESLTYSFYLLGGPYQISN